jgi:putative ABC transport system permease protein
MDNLVFSNIAHRPARTFVSMLGIAVGVLLIVFTVGLAHGMMRERGAREANVNAQIIVRASGSTGISGSESFNLPVSHAEELAQIEGVRAAVPIGTHTVNSESGFGIRVIEGIPFAQYAAMTGLRIVAGRGLNETGDELIVDAKWMNENRKQLGEAIKLYERDFRIVGIYEPPGGIGRMKMPLRTLQEQLGYENRCSSIYVACQNPSAQDAVAERIRARFPDDQIIFTRDLPEFYTTSIPALNIFLNVVVGVAATISTLVILLAMYTTVTERTRQIGILKALGMSNARIAWVIEQEALLVSALGVIFGILLTLAVRFIVTRSTNLIVEIEPRWLVIALLIGLIGGTFGAIYPALRAARQDAVEALSYE